MCRLLVNLGHLSCRNEVSSCFGTTAAATDDIPLSKSLGRTYIKAPGPEGAVVLPSKQTSKSAISSPKIIVFPFENTPVYRPLRRLHLPQCLRLTSAATRRRSTATVRWAICPPSPRTQHSSNSMPGKSSVLVHTAMLPPGQGRKQQWMPTG